MTERFRFRLLRFVAWVLRFDLSEVTPEDLRRPEPPETDDWYVWRQNLNAVYSYGRYIDMPEDDELADKRGPYQKSAAAEMLRTFNEQMAMATDED